MLTPESINFTRVNNDVNGNPRYVCHFYNLLTNEDEASIRENFGASLSHNPLLFTSFCYDEAVLKAKKIGGRKFHNKQYGGGIVFQSYNIQSKAEAICNLVNESK